MINSLRKIIIVARLATPKSSDTLLTVRKHAHGYIIYYDQEIQI